MIKRTAIWLVLLLIPYLSFSTHIVGGVLNYTYNGNNIYTVTLKLYRDCGSSAAAFPANVTIKVKGNNGANLSPSKDLTINLGTITTLSANLLPCAVAPNPIPCVQEGVYTKTISLPPSVGGYHLYYQVSARNLSLTNINGVCNCIGESFYAFIPNNTVSSNSNSNATFNLFPPLFICSGEPLTFNHSATDLDGDSLAYSLYTPYDDNVVPTYTNNIAYFPEVIYQPGYTTNNPLGATPFHLNPVTGILTATPSTIGQFVVGVRVTEYRHGVSISQTLRDFQFNVLNCPAPPPTLAISNMTINNGCAVKVNATGITSASSTWHSIYPGASGTYNNYLSCTSNCLNPTITAVGTPPPYADFVVCGIATNCLGNNVCDTFRVYFNPPLSVSVAPGNPALCNGQTSTTITAIGSGGTPPYNYLWNNVNPTQTISVGAGTYNIKLTDASGCPPAYSSALVTSYSVPVSVNAGTDKTVCITSPVATINTTISGASGGIWSGGTGTFSPNNTTTSNLFYTPASSELTTGSVTLALTTTGSGACPAATDTVVIYYSGFTGTVLTSTTAVSCYGGANGSATVNITGGMGPHTYVWNTVPSQSAATAANLSSGNYSVNITNAIGCQVQNTIAISQPLPIAINSTLSNVFCFGGSNGSLTVASIGGTSPYTYSWSPGSQTTTSLTGLTAGTYTTKVTDTKNCIQTSTFSITQPSSLTIAFTQTNISCFNGSNGIINSIVSGGTSPYTYSWNPGSASSPNINGLQAGTFTLNVKDNLNCSLTKTVSLTQPTVLAITGSITNETCNSLNNGSISANVTGGTPGYNFLWQPGSLNTSAISNLASGNYSLSVTDAKSCTSSTVFTVNEPTALAANIINPVNVNCFSGNNGSVTASASGGTSGYTYSWSPSGVTTNTLSNLTAGTYTILVSDSKSCSASNTVTITQPASLTVSAVQTSVSCFGGNNGTAALTAGGGTSPYSYFWSPAGQISSSITGLSAGTYTSLITDAKNCTLSISQIITQASSLSVAFSATNVSCFTGTNGALSSLVSGGNGSYTYTWTPGNINTQMVSGLAAGTYTLNAKDLFTCTITKTVSITQPSQLQIATTITNETCNYLNNGTAAALASGGTAGYTYSWQPVPASTSSISNLASGNYTVFVTDSKSCFTNTVVTISEPTSLSVSIVTLTNVSCYNGNNGSATVLGSGGTPNYSYTWTPGGSNSAMINGLSQGIYSVSVSDSKSCISQTIINITQPSSIAIVPAISPVSCNGGSNGSIALSPNGGTSPYSYLWLPAGQTTSSLTNLSAGSYSVNLHDANGCFSNANYAVTQSSSLSIVFTTTQVSCFSGSDGRINSSVTGGNSPYTFSWDNGSSTSQNITGLTAGIHTLSVTDNLNCNSSKTVTISQSSPLAITTTVTNETCNYLNNGTAAALASGGTAGYTYSWQPVAASTSSISNLASGNYTVFVTDSKSCFTNTVVTISEPTSLSVSIVTLTNVSCYNGNNGSATVLGSGGTPNYSYTWTPGGSNSAMINNLSQGIYSVSVSDSKSCISQTIINITQPSSIAIVPAISPVSCNGGSNGSIALSPNGGTSPYSYFWLPAGQTTSSLTNLSAGSYSVNVHDANGCFSTANYTVTQSSSLSIAFTTTQVSCFSGSDGRINSSVTGGNSPYTFSWDNGSATSQNITGLTAGIHTLSVTDNLNCSSSKTITISQPSPLAITTTLTNETCNYLNNGTATALASGGIAGYSYSWQPVPASTSSISNLASGTYSIFVTDLLGCTGNSLVTITEPSSVVAAFTNILDVSCNGGNDGSATVIGSGGTPNYTYSWTTGNQTTNMITNLSAGIYSVTVADHNGCTTQNTVSISEPAPLNLIPTISNVMCNGGSNGAISISMSGGTSPYAHNLMPGNIAGANFANLSPGTYSINTNDANGCLITTTIAINQPINISTSTSYTNADCATQNGVASISITSGGTPPFSYNWLPTGGTSSLSTNLYAGSYSVEVTDASGCVSTKIVNINNVNAPIVSIVSTTNVICAGGSNGAITATYSGGTGACTYSWSPFGGTGLTASNLSSGIYIIQITDIAGCIGLATSSMIAEPPPIAVCVFPTNVSCFGGINGGASATISGGTAGYTFNWLPGGITTSSINGLSANNYTLEIEDANNCVQTSTFVITQPTAPLNLSISSSSVSCFGGSDGSLTALASGGTSPYNYNTLPGNLNGQTISNLSNGIYTITANDFKSCTTTNTIAVNQPLPIVLVTGALNSNCSFANGQVSVTASGGKGFFVYMWMPPVISNSIATNLLAGSYTVTVLDGNNCLALASETVIDNPAPLISVSSITNVSCYNGADGAVTALVSGGSAPFTYTWLPTGGTTSTGSGLSAGNYSVTTISANGCTVTTASPVITEPSPIFITLNSSDVSCFGGSNGGASATINGGTPGYTYNWQGSASTTNTVTGLSSGIYTLQATDANGCVQSNSVLISEPVAAISLTLSALPASCFGAANGSASVTVSGGTAPFNFNWVPGNFSGQSVSNLIAGIYSLTATDLNGCSLTTTVSVNEPAPVSLIISSINSNCSFANGQLSVTATGGTNSFSYNWSPNGGTSSNATNLLAGSYTVTVLDGNNCIALASETVIDNPAPLISVSSITNVSCYNGADGAATALVSGGTAPFSYSWLPTGGTTSTGSGLSAGNYSVTIISANGCTVTTASPVITEPSPIFLILNPSDVSCFGGSNGGASATINGGTPAYTYNWQGSASTTNTVTGLSSGIYTLQATDANGCVQSNSVLISEPVAAIGLTLSALPASCFGAANGSASVTVSGGTAPFNFNWMPGNFSGQSVSNLIAGIYSLTATDLNGCSLTTTVSVNEPTPVSLIISSINSNCSFANGQLSVTATGGTNSFSYNWSPNGGTNSNAINLLAGSYTVTVLDGNNCIALASETVIDNPAPLISVSSITNVSCYNGADGAATALVSGGTSPFTYSWLPTGGTSSIATGFSAGSYSVQVFSANGCSATSSASLISEPSQISTNITTFSVNCFGDSNGSATLMTGGGTPGYTYTWPSGASTNTILSGLSAGNYLININDANNCLQTETFVIVQPSAPLSVSVSTIFNVSCFAGTNGRVSVAVSGGTPLYSFNWLPSGGTSANAMALSAGTYSANIVDNNGCNTFTIITVTEPTQALSAISNVTNVSCFGGSNGSAIVTPSGGTAGYTFQWSPTGGSLQSATALSFGTYSVTVTDLNLCQTELPVFINQPGALTQSLIPVNAACGLANGSISSQISGGTGPYSFSWQSGSFTSTSINSLVPGTYTLVTTDAANCIVSSISSLINIPGPLLNISSVKNVSCFGANNGSATLTINQGTAPFNVNWLPFGGNTNAGTSLLAGTYTSNVTDALGCIASKTVIITEPILLNASIVSVKNVSCFGDSNGSLSVVANGGTPSYTYAWIPFNTGSTINNLFAGTYTLNLRDANNCTLSISANVPQPTALTSSITGINNAPCYSGMGNASVSATGGEAPYSYTWYSNPIQTGNILSNVVSGNYNVIIKDANNCVTEKSATISQPSQVVTTVSKNDTVCFGKTGLIKANASGGAGNYHYTWLPGAITNSGSLSFTAASTVIYTVLAFDDNGCSGLDASSKITVYNLSPASVSVEGLTLVCPGKSSVIGADVHGNTGPLKFSWNNNLPPIAGPHIVTPAQASTYILTISNSCGASLQDSIRILINDLPIVNLSSDTLNGCTPSIFNFIDKSQPINSADPLISWTWDFGDGNFSGEQNPSHTYTVAGTYTVNLEVTSDRGCSNKNTSAPVIIQAYPKPSAAFVLNSDLLNLPYDILKCTNQSTGAVNYNWSFGIEGTSTVPDPEFLMQTLGNNKIQLIAFSNYSCSDTTYKYVTTNADIVFPNAFTPNLETSSGGSYIVSSLNNDVFFPYTSGVVDYSLQIFDRWGELIFESTDLKQGWDGYYRGKLCQEGVYVWKAHVVLNNGKVFDKSGNISLLR